MKYKNRNEFEKANMFGVGVPNEMFSEYFLGNSFLNPLTKPGECPVFMANVTFEPGCRNNWHIHHATSGGGQILICTAGEGWYQEEGKEAVSLHEGSVVCIPAEVKHWHGAKADSWFSHIAFAIPGDDTKNEWLEAVSDEEYKNCNGQTLSSNDRVYPRSCLCYCLHGRIAVRIFSDRGAADTDRDRFDAN